jgi:hypothetical protein
VNVLERETEHIVGVIGQKTIGQAPSIALREILAADVLPAVKTFFRTDVEALLLEEHRSALKQSRFRYDHPDVRTAQTQYHSALVMHYSFSRKEFLARLSDAVHLLANYLVRPQWTLTGVVFEKEPAISVEALHRLLQYFAPYPYIRDVLFRYAGDRKIAAFTKEEFSALLWKIDAAFVRRKTGQEICDALLPLYEFFDYPGNSGKNAIPVKALIRFFEDKGLTDVQTRLEGELAQGLTELPSLSLAAILEDIRQASGQFVVERSDQKTAEAITGGPGTGPAGEGTDAAGTAGGRGPERSGPDIASAIQEAERRKFVRKIFNQEEQKYDEAIRQLSMMTGWKEASKHIDEIFIRNDIDPYSAEAERFTEIVFQQYHPPR